MPVCEEYPLRAIVSVSDKAGLSPFVKGLVDLGVEVYSTGGTKKALEDAGLTIHSISEITGFPEILDGRVKTLHPKVYGGILALRSSAVHMKELAEHAITPIDLVVCNLYPFVRTVSQPGVALEDALENIDIGGPSMIRASAKNFQSVLTVVDPADYEWLLEGLKGAGVLPEKRRALAAKAFQHVALYDTAIATYLRGDSDPLASELTIGLTRLQSLRYGENPHQNSAFYREVLSPEGGLASAKQVHGKELSYNNIIDADAAWNAVRDFDAPTFAIIKHTNPCGLASNEDLAEAYRRAFEGDTVSAFGGIVASNRKLTLAAAEEIAKIFVEIVIAPGYEPEALERLSRKRDLRILDIPANGTPDRVEYRRISGGMLVQDPDLLQEDPASWKAVTERKPTAAEMADLAFAWKAVKHIKSNAIALIKDRALVGMGAGQPNRVTSVHLALRRAEGKAKGSVLSSDAFFPFADGVELAGEGGITAIVQPGGSIRDAECIAAANKYGMAMLFTNVRHFKH